MVSILLKSFSSYLSIKLGREDSLLSILLTSLLNFLSIKLGRENYLSVTLILNCFDNFAKFSGKISWGGELFVSIILIFHS